ncbi:hypothetical protein CRUP_004132 [Coryphaenoides rupestris]|nr:hypothetical protein CRUP_004132 [Coryphaenoides rupestris]
MTVCVPPLSSSLASPLPPALLLTPKRTLRMEEEEELHVPQMKDFGMLENTILNNDFTMSLDRLASHVTNARSGQPPPQPVSPDLPPKRQNLMPEFPKLQSMFGNTLLSRCAQGVCLSPEDPGVDPRVSSSLEVDIPNPCMKLAYWDFPIPEMPELSTVTWNICKRTELKKQIPSVVPQIPRAREKENRTTTILQRTELKKQIPSVVPQIPRAREKENRDVLLPLVADSEFQRLPRYLRQMSLRRLNNVIRKINKSAAIKHHQGEALQFQAEELNSVAGVGIRAPVYFLCLQELHRLEQVQSGGNSPVYKLLPQH